MQLPLYRRLTDEDLSDAPKGNWKIKLLYAYNLWMQQLFTGLSNNLTPEQNCIEQTKVFTLIGSATPANNIYTFVSNYSYNPNFIEYWITVIDGSNPVFTTSPYVTLDYLNGNIRVLGISGLTDGVKYQVTIRTWFPGQVNR